MDSAISYLRHLLRSNTLTNSRRNISQHYDLVQIFFSLPFCCCQMDILHHSDMRKCHFLVVFLWVSTHIFCKTELEPWSPEITNIECVSVESWQKSSVYFDCKLLCHYGRVVILSNSQVQEVVLIRVIELCVYSKLKWDLLKSLNLVNETLTVSIIESMKFLSIFTSCGGCKHMSFLMDCQSTDVLWWVNRAMTCSHYSLMRQWHIHVQFSRCVTDYFPLLCFSLTSYERRQGNIVYDHYWQ
jgi:hypothetical protein